jgi:hypothetical protein
MADGAMADGAPAVPALAADGAAAGAAARPQTLQYPSSIVPPQPGRAHVPVRVVMAVVLVR